MVEIAEDTAAFVETTVEDSPMVVVGMGVIAMGVVPTFVVADSALEAAREVVVAIVAVVETYYKFLSSKKYTVAYYTSNT